MAFFALPLDPAESELISKCLLPLRERFPSIGWEHPADYHITLRFLGGLSPEKLHETLTHIDTVAPSMAPQALQIGELSVFPPRHRQGILWVGLKQIPPALAGLVSQLEKLAQDLGFNPETRPFLPHITVARFAPEDWQNLSPSLASMPPFPAHQWLVTRYVFMTRRRDIERGGTQPVYQALRTIEGNQVPQTQMET